MYNNNNMSALNAAKYVLAVAVEIVIFIVLNTSGDVMRTFLCCAETKLEFASDSYISDMVKGR